MSTINRVEIHVFSFNVENLGLGGYAMLALGNFAGVSPFVAVPIAALGAALVAWPLSWIAFRLQGGYFAIGTWVIAEVLRLSVANRFSRACSASRS